MTASRQTVEQIVEVMLKHMDRKTALKMAREVFCHVQGNQSVTQTFRRIVEELVEKGD